MNGQMNDDEIRGRIDRVRRERNAVILAHNYELGEVQDVADFCGDSLELAVRAADADADVIVFCGVRFMAETAKILSPDKTVLLPAEDAGCAMADMIDAEAVRCAKAGRPGMLAVSSTARRRSRPNAICA